VESEHAPVTMADICWTLFFPQVEKLRAEGIRSRCPRYWQSRYYDWISYAGNDTTGQWQAKRAKELAWPGVWETYHAELCRP
jgi:hypothetical protein